VNRRHALRALVALLVPTAGCSTDAPVPADGSPTPTRTGTPTATGTGTGTGAGTGTSSVPDPGELDDDPDYDHTLRVRNDAPSRRTVAVVVTHRGTGRVVYEASHDLEADEAVAAFEFSRLADDYEGVQSFEIRADSGGRSASATFRTSRCNALPEVIVSADDLSVVYGVC
jgi:hypothetical protein